MALVAALLTMFAVPSADALGQGFGTQTRGGLDGRIVKVTTLADSGPGSLRAAAGTRGARTIVFEVGGTIALESDIRIPHPHVTIAGQTAPSPGITLSGGGLRIATHDVVVQHLRIRIGEGPGGTSPHDRDAIAIIGKRDGTRPVYNVVIDHCSVSWAIDEGISTFFPPVHDITIRNSIIAEMLTDAGHPKGAHAYGLLIGKGSRNVSVIRNLFAHNMRRNPVGGPDTTSVIVNNVVYNAAFNAIHFYGGAPVLSSVVGNEVIAGPSSWRRDAVHFQRRFHPASRIHLNDNIGPLGTDPEALIRADEPEEIPDTIVPEPPLWPPGLAPLPAAEVADALLPVVGARPWDRDATDRRIIADVENGTGTLLRGTRDLAPGPVPEPTYRPLAIPAGPPARTRPDGSPDIEAWLAGFAQGRQAGRANEGE